MAEGAEIWHLRPLSGNAIQIGMQLDMQKAAFAVFEQYRPPRNALSPEASRAVRKGKYARLFDAAAEPVRAWEKANPARS